MKILWICGSRVVGGAERVTLQLAALLRARRHVIEALCQPRGPVEQALIDVDLKAHRGPLGGSLNPRAALAIHRAVDNLAPDVALVTTSDEWVSSCLAKRRRSRTRLVLVRHMAVPLTWTVRWLADRRADAVIAVSQTVRRSLLGRAGIAPERIHVIHNPVRFSFRSVLPEARDRARAREALGLSSNGRWVGFFGGLSAAKGLRDLLAAIRRANREVGLTDLLVCGRPGNADRSAIAELAREFQLEGRIHDLGQTERVEEAMTASDVVVMATHRALGEALPATLMEAMACGTPVAGYATGGILEVIGDDAAAGSLARSDDVDDLGRVLVELLADPERARRQAGAALARVREKFDPQQAADQCEQLFTRLCAP